MDAIGTTKPDTDPALQRLMVASRSQLSERLLDRERLIEVASALAFVVVAAAIAAIAPATRAFDPAMAAALVALYALATRVEFQMGTGWTDPSQLVFVPMLFLLPTEAVPLLVALALLASRTTDYFHGEVHLNRVVPRIGDAWYSVWPVLVLLATGATSPDWADWPIYLAALAAQLGLDLLTTTARVTYALRVPWRTLLDELRAIYLVDVLLAPAGLVVAFAAASEPAAILTVLPLIALIGLFARERSARIENALTLSSTYRGTAHLLGEVLSTNDEYTGSHSRSVLVIAHQVGVALELDEAALREIEFGALLHDVGKMAVPNEILNKPGRLTPEEMEIMQTHTLEGARMLGRIGGVLEEVGEIVRSHHEHWDGNGYPDGLRGEEIPIAARVIACCDAFNAMTTDRPYRQAMGVDDAVAELRANAGTQFDPRVVDALIAVVSGWEATADRGLVGPGAEPQPGTL
jgi:putative nucleotidyltransferase with HDIG domain